MPSETWEKISHPLKVRARRYEKGTQDNRSQNFKIQETRKVENEVVKNHKESRRKRRMEQ